MAVLPSTYGLNNTELCFMFDEDFRMERNERVPKRCIS